MSKSSRSIKPNNALPYCLKLTIFVSPASWNKKSSTVVTIAVCVDIDTETTEVAGIIGIKPSDRIKYIWKC